MNSITFWARLYHPLTAAFCFAALGVGYYLQWVFDMAPCPLCILQRYMFLAIGLTALPSSFFGSRWQRKGAIVELVFAMAGLVTAAWLMWVRAHPSVSCGVDKLQVALNKLPTADMLPAIFRSEGLCTGEWEPILRLPVSTWSFIAFLSLIVFLLVMPRSSKRL